MSRRPDRDDPAEVREVPKDSPDSGEHNERMRTHGRPAVERIERVPIDVPPNIRTVRAFRNRRRVIE